MPSRPITLMPAPFLAYVVGLCKSLFPRLRSISIKLIKLELRNQDLNLSIYIGRQAHVICNRLLRSGRSYLDRYCVHMSRIKRSSMHGACQNMTVNCPCRDS
jgi:hypothetical protein